MLVLGERLSIALTHELLWIFLLFKGHKGHPGPPGSPGEQVRDACVIGCDVLVAAEDHLTFSVSLSQGIPGPPGETGEAGYPGRQVQ